MTSEILWKNKVKKEEFRRQMPMVMLTIFYFILVMISMGIVIQNAAAAKQSMKQVMLSYLLPNGFLIVTTILLAFISGIYTFSYLHSKQRVDMYHALPINRTKLFDLITNRSFEIFAFFQAITLGLQLIVSAAAGVFSGELLLDAVITLCSYGLIFLANYYMAALAMILTGNIAVGVLGTAVFATWIPIMIRFTLADLYRIFFATYVTEPSWSFWLDYGSPSSVAFSLAQGMDGEWTVSYGCWILLLWVAVLQILTKSLFKNRPSEAAGNAMAFPRWNGVIKTCITVPYGIFFGTFFYSLANESGRIWLWLGLVLGIIIIHAICEMIFQLDPRAIFSHKKELIAILAAMLLFVGTFAFDVYGYDDYVPKADKVKSVRLDDAYFYQDVIVEEEADEAQKGAVGEEKMKEIIEVIRENIGEQIKDTSLDSVDTDASSVRVVYYMEDGKEIWRSYVFPSNVTDKIKTAFMNSKDYKKSAYSIYSIDTASIRSIDIYTDGWKSQELEKDDRAEFIKIYREELLNLTYETVKNVIPTTRFNLTYRSEDESDDDQSTNVTSNDYYIYPSFEKSIAFLEEKGYTFENQFAHAKLQKIRLYSDDMEQEITEEKLIEKVKNSLYAVDSLPDDYRDEMGKYGIQIDGTIDGQSFMELDVVTDESTLKILLKESGVK